MSEYSSLSHAKTYLRYHIIFSTKYRRKCFVGIDNSVKEAFRYAESMSNFKIFNCGVDKDHIHILIEFKPSYSMSQVVRRLKQLTTFYLWKNNEDHLKKFFWKKKIVWTNGYFCSTVGYNLEKTIANYINSQ